jgi:uncharacterized protein YbjQ (UPF0145 family)
MTTWDGRGLPPAAEARMERASAGGPASSLLSIAGQSAIEGCGFSIVGEVMGCIVQHIGFQGYGGCGFYGGYGGYGGLGTSGGFGFRPGAPFGTGAATAVSLVGFAPYVDALYHGYDTAMIRMLTECRELGGDGVVGVSLTAKHLGEGNREFLAYGTAVRAHSRARPANLFSTMLPGNDVAKLLHGGWAPVAVSIGISLAIRHDDWATLQQARTWAGNTEVSGYTQLVHQVRMDARRQFARRTAAFGAEGAITDAMQLDIWEIEPGEGHRDHVALSSVMGTAITRFHSGSEAPTSSLVVLPLSDPDGPPGRKP